MRATAFDAAKKDGGGKVEKVAVSLDAAKLKAKFVAFNETKSDRPVLTEASIVGFGRTRPQERRELHHLSRAAL